jgi:predicted NUDIX family NTP pyrophosphohydrolase
MPKLSAGILLYRQTNRIEVFLVHPGGPFWAKKDVGTWSIPKGEYTEDEEPRVAAAREFTEEVGKPIPKGEWLELHSVKYGNKNVIAWAVEGDMRIETIQSNQFTMEWPPKSGQQQSFPEVDKADWFSLEEALLKLVKGQAPFIEQLAVILKVPIEVTTETETLEDQLRLF